MSLLVSRHSSRCISNLFPYASAINCSVVPYHNYFKSQLSVSQDALNLHSNIGIFTSQRASLRINSYNFGQPVQQEEVKDTKQEYSKITKETIALVNDQLAKGEEGRLFAVIHVAGKQFVVTQEDIIIIHGPWPPSIADQIKFEKVMLLGGSDFTLIGRPVLSPELVTVTGTVVDKDLSHVKTKFRFQKRQQFRRINFIRSPLTMVRINLVKVLGKVNEQKDFERKVYF